MSTAKYVRCLCYSCSCQCLMSLCRCIPETWHFVQSEFELLHAICGVHYHDPFAGRRVTAQLQVRFFFHLLTTSCPHSSLSDTIQRTHILLGTLSQINKRHSGDGRSLPFSAIPSDRLLLLLVWRQNTLRNQQKNFQSPLPNFIVLQYRVAGHLLQTSLEAKTIRLGNRPNQ